ncbi:MAG: ATP-binding protein [Nitrospinales bacterium]
MIQNISKSPIRTKIILGFTCVIFLVAVFIILFSINDNKTFAIKSAKKEIKGITKLVAETTGFGFDRLDFDYVLKSIEWLKEDPRIACIKIFDKNENLIASFDNSLLPKVPPPSSLLLDKPYLVDETLFYASKIEIHDAVLQKSNYMGRVFIGLSLKTLNQEIWANQYQSILFAIAVFLVSMLFIVIFSTQITKPIQHLSEISNKVAEKRDYSLRAMKKSDDELGLLIDQYNDMLAQIQKQDKASQDMNAELEIRVQKRTVDLEAAKKTAEYASQAKSQFLASMSHELRTPLNAILGFGQLMHMNSEESLTKIQQVQIKEILNAGKHLLTLISEILDLTQIETGVPAITIENIEISRIVEENISLLLPMANSKNIQVINKIPLGKKYYAKVDPTRLKQILLNLLSNAIKFNKEQGTVTVDFNDEKKSFITLSVTDTGIGIDKEKEKDIFNSIHLAGSDKKADGTEIGLNITKILAQLMGGTLEYETTPGVGSCFSVNIPKGDVPSPETKTDETYQNNNSQYNDEPKYKLLYVDENPGSLSLIKHLLKNQKNIQIISAQQPKLSIEVASAQRPDLIIWNIDFPGLDGKSVQQLLQANQVTRHIPAMAISNDGKVSSINSALDAGFVSYLTKPLDIPNFLNEIKLIFK